MTLMSLNPLSGTSSRLFDSQTHATYVAFLAARLIAQRGAWFLKKAIFNTFSAHFFKNHAPLQQLRRATWVRKSNGSFYLLKAGVGCLSWGRGAWFWKIDGPIFQNHAPLPQLKAHAWKVEQIKWLKKGPKLQGVKGVNSQKWSK